MDAHTEHVVSEIEWAAKSLQALTSLCRLLNDKWWDDIDSSNPYVRATKLALIASEVFEAFEGARKNAQDDKLPHRKADEVELADALIRIFDYAGQYDLDLPGAVVEKIKYNLTRIDHTKTARMSAGGKQF